MLSFWASEHYYGNKEIGNITDEAVQMYIKAQVEDSRKESADESVLSREQ